MSRAVLSLWNRSRYQELATFSPFLPCPSVMTTHSPPSREIAGGSAGGAPAVLFNRSRSVALGSQPVSNRLVIARLKAASTVLIFISRPALLSRRTTRQPSDGVLPLRQ